mmetsp:Transcript_9254/g.10230  ORF Transcript_9254/g.10230 Transcript_9254/m.10230 type:complete len:150 (-) Transcript_9254:65-514(-)
MSRARKHVVNEALHAFPEPAENQSIGIIVSLPGSNICEVETSEGAKQLYRIPSKFLNVVWMRKNDFVIIEEYPNLNKDQKVRGSIMHKLRPPQIRHIKSIGKWPERFATDEVERKDDFLCNSSSEEEFVNPNHQVMEESSSDEGDDYSY